jgi:RNA recognition motif. (a.k.a. RRM, RBD, or RNP domain)
MEFGNRTLRVRNISDDTSPNDLRSLFSRCGPVSRVQIQSDDPGHVSALLLMSEEDVEDALEDLNGWRWRGRRLMVEEEPTWWDSA